MSTLASLNIRIGGDSAVLRKELTRANNSVKNFAKNARANINKYGKAAVVAGGLVAGSLLAIYNQQASLIDQTAKFSDRIGVTTQALTEMRYAANLSGLQSNALDMSLQRMTRRIAEATKGAGEAAPALKQLGLDAQQLGKMTPDQQLNAVADALIKVQNQSERIRLAFKMFDSEGVGMLKLLENGSAG